MNSLAERDRRVLWHPYTQMQGAPLPIAIARAADATLYDTEGRPYLDAISSWWVTLHGHAHPHIAAAIARQARELEQVIFAGFTHRPAVELAERLVAILPAGLDRIFYSDNGSTAVEVALKMAVQYWRNLGRPERTGFIALEHAYHGDTLGAMAVSERSLFTQAFEPLLFPVHRTHTAYCHRCPVGKARATCAIECLGQLENHLSAHATTTAAVIVEPLLQAAGGMIMQPREFLQGVARLCRAHGVLLIVDEVLTGFGRTGTMFACQQADVHPDILCMAKGLTAGFLPMAATACTAEVYAAFLSDDRQKTFFHGHSFTANPLGCAAALASLEVFAQEPVMERIAALSAHQAQRAAALQGHARVADVRTIGTVAALELHAAGGYLAAAGPRLHRFALDHGVLLRPLGAVVYVLPPYCMTGAELDQVWDVITLGLNAMEG